MQVIQFDHGFFLSVLLRLYHLLAHSQVQVHTPTRGKPFVFVPLVPQSLPSLLCLHLRWPQAFSSSSSSSSSSSCCKFWRCFKLKFLPTIALARVIRIFFLLLLFFSRFSVCWESEFEPQENRFLGRQRKNFIKESPFNFSFSVNSRSILPSHVESTLKWKKGRKKKKRKKERKREREKEKRE